MDPVSRSALRIVGVPPRAAVVAWEEATASGQPLASQMAPHRDCRTLGADSGSVATGPYALAAAAARVVEALVARIAAAVFVFRRD